MERGGIGLHHFSDQSYAPAGKHTSNNRSTTRSTTVLLVVVNVVCRVQTVTSHQQETVSKTTADLITQINNFLRRRRRADRWSAAASDLRRRAY
jgi:hypothetical protein